MISFEGSKAFLAYAKKRLPANSSSWIKEGVVQGNLDRYLTERFETDEKRMMIISSTRVEMIHYCQAGLGSTRSLRSKTEDFGNDHLRWDELSTPARGTFGNHDFVVLDLTATPCREFGGSAAAPPRGGEHEGRSIQFSIRAEKEGGGQGGGDPGIYINGLTVHDRRNLTLQGNIIASYNGFSTLVPLDVLVRNLYEGHDTQYNLLNNNCWVYAKAACKSVLELLRRQDIYNLGHNCLPSPDLYWAESIVKVEKSVQREDKLQLFVAGNFSSRVRVIAILSMRHVRNLHHVIIEKWKIFRNMREFAKILEKDFPEFDEMIMSSGVGRKVEMILEEYLPVFETMMSSKFYGWKVSESKMMSQRVRREFEMILREHLPMFERMMPSGLLKFKMILEKHFPEFVMKMSPVLRRKFEMMTSLGVRGKSFGVRGEEDMRSWPLGPSSIRGTMSAVRGMRYAVAVCGPWPLVLYEPKINWSNLIILFLTDRRSSIELISLLRETLTLKTLKL